MKSHLPLALGLSISGLSFPLALAADGTWTNATTGGLWSDGANWNATTIADGNGFTANFATLDLTADNTVQLDSARTIGNLTFGDTATATAGGWALSNNGSASNILTLGVGSGAPVITVNTLGTAKNATINLELAGTQGMTKAGAGELQLAGINTYSGTTTVSAGTLLLKGTAANTSGGTILNSSAINVAQGATLTLSNDATNGIVGNRIADNAAITLNGGTFNFTHAAASNTSYSETVGQLAITSGMSRISTTTASATAGATTLTFDSLNRSTGALLNFTNSSQLGATRNKILFAGTAPTLDDGIIGGWATVGGSDFATYGANGVAVASYTANTEPNWVASNNVKVTAATTLTGHRQINALAIAQAADTNFNLGGFTMRVESGGVIVGNNFNSSITNGNLTAGTGDDTAGTLYLMAHNFNRTLTVSANITDNGTGAVSVVTDHLGGGTAQSVTLSGNNTYTGTTTIASEWLVLGSSTALNNSKGLTITQGATMNMGGFTATVDGLSGSGLIDVRNGTNGATSGSQLIFGNGGGSAIFTGTFNVAGSAGRDLDLVKNGAGTQILAGQDNRDVTTSGSPSTTTVNGGTLQFARTASLYNSNSARWNATNLIINNGGTLALNVGGTGEFTSAHLDTIKGLGTATGGFQSGSKLGIDTTNAVGGNFTYASAIANTNGGANSVGLTKLGTGTLTLTASSTYTGATTVSAGSLFVNGSLGTTNVTANGGTFGGTGSTGGNVTINAATYAAGASTGSFEIAGDLGLGASSNTTIEIGGTAFALNGTEEYDRTKLTGTTSALNLGGGSLGISLVNGFTLMAGQAFGIIQLGDTATRTGTFAGLGSDGSLVGNYGGIDLYITYSGNFGDTGTIDLTGGNDIVLYAVPEPAAAGIGALGMLLILRRRRA